MTAEDFLLALIILLIVFLYRGYIAEYINNKFEFKYKVEKIWVTYFLIFLLSVISVVGMLTKEDKPHGTLTVSGGVENIKPVETDKPHRWFDINFDVFDF
ncbi:MAG: hypothetical protein U9Q33_09290 [Campylobacterota bacterium]|nr:hypothetical protein [Campylobacterota bacterium]